MARRLGCLRIAALRGHHCQASVVFGASPERVAWCHAEIERDGVIRRGVGSRVYVIVAVPAEQVVLA